jgi:hypothetical protein
MLSPAERRLKSLWLKALAADPSERELLLFQFRDALHEDLKKLRAQGVKKFPKFPRWTRLAS